MEKCATIASACNRYWRKKHLSKDTVAVEPVRGWRGAQFNQSEVALEWLMWQEQTAHVSNMFVMVGRS